MLPNKPELTTEEKHTIKSLFAEDSSFSSTTKEIINGLVFGSDELFNVLTPFKIITKNRDRDYLRSVFDIQVGMELERDGKNFIVDQELTSSEKLVIEVLSTYYKKIRDAIREDKHADTAFIHLSKKDFNMMNKQARELVQEAIYEVINGWDR